MLVLSRGRGTAIRIGSEVTIRVLEIHKQHVQLGIEAPSCIPVRREEIPFGADRSKPIGPPELNGRSCGKRGRAMPQKLIRGPQSL